MSACLQVSEPLKHGQHQRDRNSRPLSFQQETSQNYQVGINFGYRVTLLSIYQSNAQAISDGRKCQLASIHIYTLDLLFQYLCPPTPSILVPNLLPGRQFICQTHFSGNSLTVHNTNSSEKNLENVDESVKNGMSFSSLSALVITESMGVLQER